MFPHVFPQQPVCFNLWRKTEGIPNDCSVLFDVSIKRATLAWKWSQALLILELLDYAFIDGV